MDFVKTIVQKADLSPYKVAIKLRKHKLTYKNLICGAIDIANKLNAILPNQIPCVLLMDRCFLFYQAMLGTFIGNFIYTPININAPLHRNQKIISQLDRCVVITSHIKPSTLKALSGCFNNASFVTDDSSVYDQLMVLGKRDKVYLLSKIKQVENRKYSQSTKNIAYLLFTSGSTGVPKGVPISYQNINAYLKAVIDTFSFRGDGNYAQLCDIGFDLSLHEMLTCLVAGGTLYPYIETDALGLGLFLSNHHINYAIMVPSLIPLLLKQAKLLSFTLNCLKYLFFCGEPLLISHVRKLFYLMKDTQIVNLYGPTEATIACTYHIYNPTDLYEGLSILPIGKPFNAVLLKSSQSKELLIKGRQVFSGYLNKSNISGYYHTGDLISVHSRYGYCYIGRSDDQWQVKGYRIERAEIESVFRYVFSYEQIYVAPYFKNKQLIDGLVVFSDRQLDLKKLHNQLSNALPAVLFPFTFYKLNLLPRLANQKINYQFLKLQACKLMQGCVV